MKFIHNSIFSKQFLSNCKKYNYPCTFRHKRYVIKPKWRCIIFKSKLASLYNLEKIKHIPSIMELLEATKPCVVLSYFEELNHQNNNYFKTSVTLNESKVKKTEYDVTMKIMFCHLFKAHINFSFSFAEHELILIKTEVGLASVLTFFMRSYIRIIVNIVTKKFINCDNLGLNENNRKNNGSNYKTTIQSLYKPTGEIRNNFSVQRKYEEKNTKIRYSIIHQNLCNSLHSFKIDNLYCPPPLYSEGSDLFNSNSNNSNIDIKTNLTNSVKSKSNISRNYKKFRQLGLYSTDSKNRKSRKISLVNRICQHITDQPINSTKKLKLMDRYWFFYMCIQQICEKFVVETLDFAIVNPNLKNIDNKYKHLSLRGEIVLIGSNNQKITIPKQHRNSYSSFNYSVIFKKSFFRASNCKVTLIFDPLESVIINSIFFKEVFSQSLMTLENGPNKAFVLSTYYEIADTQNCNKYRERIYNKHKIRNPVPLSYLSKHLSMKPHKIIPNNNMTLQIGDNEALSSTTEFITSESKYVVDNLLSKYTLPVKPRFKSLNRDFYFYRHNTSKDPETTKLLMRSTRFSKLSRNMRNKRNM